jgi:L-alanine-DL-glutamate epimerase-like enolase superfamily enzyme
MAGDVVVNPVRLDTGTIRLEDHPGLSATVDPDALKRYRVSR